MTALAQKLDSLPRLASISRREAVLGGLLLGTAAAAGAIELREKVAKPVSFPIGDGLPNQLGERTSLQSQGLVRPAEEAEDKSIYDQEVSRVYLAEGLAPIMLLIAYGSTQSDTLQLHRPEFCYPASGFQISETQQSPQPVGSNQIIPASFFTGVRDDRVEHVLYWTRLGDQFPDSWIGQHLARMKNSLRGLVPDGVLVRASLISPDASEAHTTLQAFLEQLVTGASPRVQKVLTG
jgi:EpsI family protein